MRLFLMPFLTIFLFACWPDTSADKDISFEVSTIEIVRENKPSLTLKVEMADTYEKRARGLMYRASLPENDGMLFDFPTYGTINMWMANTSVSLDMFFIDKNGMITQIVEGTVPLSEERITSSHKTKAVLEMNAGSAKRLEIKTGDKINHAIFALEKQK